VRGVAVNVGEQTGDGRYIVPGAVTHADLPLPIGWLVDGDQHADMSFRDPQVGNITSLSFVPGGVAYTGVLDDQIPEGAEALRRMREGSAPGGNRFFTSIDPDNWSVQLVDPKGGVDDGGMVLFATSGVCAAGERFDWNAPVRALRRAGVLVAAAGGGDPLFESEGSVLFEDSVDSIVARFTQLRIRGLTMCSVSAFPNCYMELDVADPFEDLDAAVAAASMTFGAIGVHHTATVNATWDGGAATRNADTPAELRYIHAWVETGGDPEAKGSYKFPHHSTEGGPANLNGVRNALSRLPQADIPSGDVAGVERHLRAHLDDGNAEGTLIAAAFTDEDRLTYPPSTWFADPGFVMPSPLTITNEGRVLGHVAVRGTCHTGYADRCVTPPLGGSYDRFHVGEVHCDDGQRFACGVFAWGIPHADLSLSLMEAWAHYSDSRYGFARVVIGEDEHGIWFSGALNPKITAGDVAVLRSLSMSGDWRRDPRSGRLSLIAALAVNFPGFPVEGERLIASGDMILPVDAPEPYFALDGDEVSAMVACGRVQPRSLTADCGCDDTATRLLAVETRLERMERVIQPLHADIAERLDARLRP
jgi:hypothetical protein